MMESTLEQNKATVSEQKVAVITGASQGIGAAVVKACRDRKYRVVATARSVKPSRDDDILVIPGDIADRNTAAPAISEGVARFGRIDTLVNNAGIFFAKPFIEYTEADCTAILGASMRGSRSFRAQRIAVGVVPSSRLLQVRRAMPSVMRNRVQAPDRVDANHCLF